ncbi:MAG: hypothetical protein ACLGI3_16810 [Actinomycetes bacterium]
MPAPVIAAAAARTAGSGAARAGAGRAAAGKAAAGKATTTAAQQAEAIQAIKDARPKPETGNPPVPSDAGGGRDRKSSGSRSLPNALTDQRGAPAIFRADGLRAANTGGGFVLGMFVYVIGLNYLREGKPGVQKWLKAKFLNEVSG